MVGLPAFGLPRKTREMPEKARRRPSIFNTVSLSPLRKKWAPTATTKGLKQ